MNRIRRDRASIGIFGVNLPHRMNPWVPWCWSFFLPGYGHVLGGKFITGWLLIGWEVFINTKSHLNTAIVYSFTGQFDKAKQVLDNHWIVLYVPVFVYTLFGSYQNAVHNSNLYDLADREDAPVKPMTLNSFEINSLDKRSPWLAALWSLLIPGLGQIYNRKLVSSVMALTWYIVFANQAHLPQALHATMTGQFTQAIRMTNPEWLLFIPSLYGFAFYDAYVTTVHYNRLFEKEQSKFLREQYQTNLQTLSFRTAGGMQKVKRVKVVSTFDHTIYLEKALIGLEDLGIHRSDIYAIPLHRTPASSRTYDSLHTSDGQSTLDGIALLAALLSALGVIYGYVLAWGPVLWGLIGFAAGGLLGWMAKLIWRRRTVRKATTSNTEVVLVVDCTDSLALSVERTLSDNFAFGIATLSVDNETGANVPADGRA